MVEEYREVNGYKGLFISNLGNYKNVDGLTFHNNNLNSYKTIKYNGNTLQTHILVATTFPEICGEWHYGYEVHHKDGNHFNNIATNLLCVTQSEHHIIHSSGQKGAFKKIVCLFGEKIVKQYDSIKECLEDTGLTRWETYGKFKKGYEYNGYILKFL